METTAVIIAFISLYMIIVGILSIIKYIKEKKTGKILMKDLINPEVKTQINDLTKSLAKVRYNINQIEENSKIAFIDGQIATEYQNLNIEDKQEMDLTVTSFDINPRTTIQHLALLYLDSIKQKQSPVG
jgi:hypothetical protein